MSHDDPVLCALAGCPTCRAFCEDVDRDMRRLRVAAEAEAMVEALMLPGQAKVLGHITHLIRGRGAN